MQSLSRCSFQPANHTFHYLSACHRSLATQAKIKKEGDISSVFVSLSGGAATPLPERFTDIKRKLLRGHEDAIVASWKHLLERLAVENKIIAEKDSAIIPQIKYEDLSRSPKQFEDAVRKRGIAVIRNVIPESEARRYKDDTEAYTKANPQTKGKSQHNKICKTHRQHILIFTQASHPTRLQSLSFTGLRPSSVHDPIQICSGPNAI